MTSPAAGADSAVDQPDYAPVPRSALGPALNDQGYYVGRVQRNLYWVTDGVYQSAFLTTPDGVVLFDAPPSIGGNLRRAVDEIAAANGVTNTVTHLVYSHHHADHGGASSLFDGDVVRIGHEETRRLLLRDDDPARPLPEVTFADHYTLEVGGERVELTWQGPNHTPDNIYIHFPDHDTLMFIDVVNAGSVPIYNLNLSEDVIGYMDAPAIALSYPWTHLICGHLGRLATRDDVAVYQQYLADIEAKAWVRPSGPGRLLARKPHHGRWIKMSNAQSTVAIIGAGNLGGTLAANFAAGGQDFLLAGRDQEVARKIAADLGGHAEAVSVDEAVDRAEGSCPPSGLTTSCSSSPSTASGWLER